MEAIPMLWEPRDMLRHLLAFHCQEVGLTLGLIVTSVGEIRHLFTPSVLNRHS